jgi:transcriptional regulator with GAF, ATPase, and Fis domain
LLGTEASGGIDMPLVADIHPIDDVSSRRRADALAPHRIIGRSPALCRVVDQLARVAPTDVTVLIEGETGTGKELIARAVHERSRRSGKPLTTVNLAAIPESLVASDLFGHEAGAFTGAVQRRIGRIETADRSTLFLDEIGELSFDVQVALLRVLQERAFERLGSSQPRSVDVRFIAATNRNLTEAVQQGTFRLDLYFRLSVFPIRLPPLRERREDIRPLAEYFLEAAARRIGRHFTAIEPESLARLEAFSWPGNIRQLQNVLERCAVLCDANVLHVPPDVLIESSIVRAPESRLGAAMLESERQMIEEALQQSGGRVSGANGAAGRLGIPGSTLESKIKRLGIDKFRMRRLPSVHS